MTTNLSHFFSMGGYAFYVWTSYTFAAVMLGLQWFIPWKKWKNYLHRFNLMSRSSHSS
jgi:heme exporter protein CcmD